MAQQTQNQSSAEVARPAAASPDIVEIGGQQYFVGGNISWPSRRGLPEDADRLDQTKVEMIGVDGQVPWALLRSMNNGQTAKIVGLAGGVSIAYSKLPVAKVVPGKDGEADRQVFPLPEGCVRRGEDILHRKFIKEGEKVSEE